MDKKKAQNLYGFHTFEICNYKNISCRIARNAILMYRIWPVMVWLTHLSLDKMALFRRQYIQMHFREWEILYID